MKMRAPAETAAPGVGLRTGEEHADPVDGQIGGERGETRSDQLLRAALSRFAVGPLSCEAPNDDAS
jgi:hypothetical protein